MLKQISALIVSLILSGSTYACDTCGGASMGSLDGQLLASNKNFIGWNTSFLHQLNGKKEKQINLSYNFFVAYSFAKKGQLIVDLPFKQVLVKNQEESSSQFGLGDASLLYNYNVFSSKSEKPSKSTLLLRVGIEFPTGYYNSENDQNTNLGSRSLDFILGAQYIFEKNDQGLNAAFTSKINTQNPFDFQYGNSYQLQTFYFVKRKTNKSEYMPFAGVFTEFIQKDQNKQFIRSLSGGSAVYGGGGLLWNWDSKLSFLARADLPISQNYKNADGNVYSNIKAQVQISYFFKKKQKISKTIKI